MRESSCPSAMREVYAARRFTLLSAMVVNNTLTLVFAARDELHNEAIVLRDVLTS
jgi:uncharacterized protein YeaO (DUF488 family)